jgi:pimeloyl-ACP methyl ester carboxylesterase
MTVAVHHKTVEVEGITIFYREAGQPGAPVVILPHGYPCSSYQFRNYMAGLGDRWHLLAPDFPGSGYSATPADFDYSFEGFSRLLEAFLEKLGVERFAIYLQDFGGWIGLRLAMRHPDRIAAIILQNGDIYEDTMGPKYEALKAYFANPTEVEKQKLAEAITEEGFKEEFLNDLPPRLADRVPPDLWKLHWSLMTGERRRIAHNVIAGLKDNLAWFPRYQAYLREHRPPALIMWGPLDGYMPEPSARAYLRDLPDAELHLLDAGHWLLETSLDEAVQLTRDFLNRVHAAGLSSQQEKFRPRAQRRTG